MNFSFELPRSNKQLLENSNGNNYFVKQVFDAAEIPSLLKAAYQDLKSKDAFIIFDHFDTFFSVVENVGQLQISNLVRAIDILYRTTENLGQMLDSYLEQDSLDRQNDFLNLTKMVMYLQVITLRAVDKFIKNNFQEQSGRKKKTHNDETSFLASYENKRYEVMIQVCNIMRLPIEKLWNMSIVEENFVNLLCDLAYRSLTRPTTKEKRVNDAIFQILGIAIKHYRHGMAFPVQIVEIMDREESAVVPIARGICCLNDDFGITSILGKLLKELIDNVNSNPSSQIASKNLSLFITEIGEMSPELSLQCLEMSQDLLNLEPYAVRNSLFTVMNSIIVNHLKGESLNDEQKTLRDELMEDLWNHMNDINSYVRSRVILVWSDLKKRDAVPLIWILQVVTRAIERLDDRTATVRKNAISLLRSFLESNPFSSKLQLDLIVKHLIEEREKMRYIREKAREQVLNQNAISTDYETRCFPQLHRILKDILSNKQQIAALQASCNAVINVESSERVRLIREYLRDGQFENAVRYVIQLDSLVGHQNEWEAMTVDEQTLYFVALLRTYLFDDFESELERQDKVIDFLEEKLAFSKAMSEAVPKLEYMLLSTTLTDVLETIEFFKTGYLFNVSGTEAGMRKMLRLLFISTGQEKNEKGEAVIKAYHTVLFHTDSTGRAHHLKVVDNFYDFVKEMTAGEYTAFELMIKHWVQSDDININIINVLFERFTLKLSDTSSDFARCCMELLILVSNAKPVVALSNKKLIIDIISSRRVLDDPKIFAGCLKLLILSNQPTDTNGIRITYKVSGYSKRFDDTETIDVILNMFKKFFFYPKLPNFELIATQSIDFLYKMCNTPDLLSQDIIHDICKKLNEISHKRAERVTNMSENGIEPSQATEMYIPAFLLPRIIFIFGYIASRELVFLDNDVYLNIKHRDELRGKHNNIDHQTFNMDGSLNRSENQDLSRISNPNTSAADANEQVYLGATAEDTLAEMITTICDRDLIGSEDGIFLHFVPILTEILRNPTKYNDPYVQRAAVLTLMRFMVVSSAFCADRIAFLMNILKKTKDASMKCNIIIGLADLTSRFANTIEPWIPNFYTMLLETDETVRLTAMKMLSYMILQAIIRATGQVSDMAACIVDDSPEIQNAAKEFFRQLIASKELEFFKILPDIVSRLSSNESPILETKFHTVMRYLLELISKDRQIESFVEKLLYRFQNTKTERQWRDVAFCLSLLNPTEKMMKKLLEQMPHYKDKIQCDEIFDYFKVIVTNANKQMLKHDLKKLAREFDVKLQKCLQYGAHANVSLDGSVIDSDATLVENKNTAAKTRNTNKGKAKKKSTKSSKKIDHNRSPHSSDEENNDDFDETIPLRLTRKRK